LAQSFLASSTTIVFVLFCFDFCGTAYLLFFHFTTNSRQLRNPDPIKSSGCDLKCETNAKTWQLGCLMLETNSDISEINTTLRAGRNWRIFFNQNSDNNSTFGRNKLQQVELFGDFRVLSME